MEKVYLISTCICVKKKYSIFHFKGYFKGEKISEVRVNEIDFSVGGEYLMKIYAKGVEKNILFGDIVKVKRLNEFISY